MLEALHGCPGIAAKHIIRDDKALLARSCRNNQSIALREAKLLDNLRVDISAAVAFIKFLYFVKHVTLSANEGLQDLGLSSTLLFINIQMN